MEVGHLLGIREGTRQIQEALLLYQSLGLQGNLQEILVVVRQFLQQDPETISKIRKID